jgi:2-polyprenyl-3-methyl-5-hydroxy-6-metoxy-1,4-benzoquinol methylase
VSDRSDLTRFRHLTFDGFKRLAAEPDLSDHERIGFPDSYRHGKTPAILADIESKLTHLQSSGRTIVDVGPGCGELARALLRRCERQQHRITMFDSKEMLDRLPDAPCLSKVAGRYPEECRQRLDELRGSVDAVLAYSMLHYVVIESSAVGFLDASLALLAPGGQLLIGDIPNVSQRRRFFASAAALAYHKALMGTDEPPGSSDDELAAGPIDDSVILALVQHARGAGFHAYVVPQAPDLPMANRREDILILRP